MALWGQWGAMKKRRVGQDAEQELGRRLLDVFGDAFGRGRKDAGERDGPDRPAAGTGSAGTERPGDRISKITRSLRDQANPPGLLPEQIDPPGGACMGSFPQAFSHVGVISAGCNLVRETERGSGA